MELIQRFMQDDEGVTSVEYGLMAAALGVGLIASMKGLKVSLSGLFTTAGTDMKPKVVN